jgi:hypothetical protein
LLAAPPLPPFAKGAKDGSPASDANREIGVPGAGEDGGDEGDARKDKSKGECKDERRDEDSGEGLGGMSFRGLCVPGEFISAAVMEGRKGLERDSSSAAADSE